MAGNENNGFDVQCGWDNDNNHDGDYSYDGYTCSYNPNSDYSRYSNHSVTQASNNYDVNKRNYNSIIIDDTEHTYWWDRLNSQQTKFAVTSTTRPSVAPGTKVTANQANALINAFTALKNDARAKKINWTEFNTIGTITPGTSVSDLNYKTKIKNTLTLLENACAYDSISTKY